MKSLGDPHDHFLVRFWSTMTGSSIHLATFAVAIATIVCAVLLRFLNRRFKLGLPELLLAIIFVSTALAFLDPSKTSGVKLLEEVPRALPGFSVPSIDLSLARELSSSAAAIAFLGLLEAMAMAKSIAAKTGQKLDMNQQCLSEGLANLTGSFFRCIPGSGSLTRSYINHTSGAATQWSGVFSAIGVALTILILAPFAQYIPKAALAGVLILTATRMTDLSALKYYWRATRFDALILAATALSAVFISVEFCILIGVFLSFAFYVPRAAQIDVSELTVTSERVIREVQSTDPRCNLLRIYNFEGELFFGCAPDFERQLDEVLEGCPNDIKVVILRLKRTRNPDAVCVHVLQTFIEKMHKRGAVVMLSGVKESMAKVLANVGLDKIIGKENIFAEEAQIWSSTIDAMRRAYTLLGQQRCQHCSNRMGSNDNAQDWSYMI